MKQINIRILLCVVSTSLFLTSTLNQEVWPDDVTYDELKNLGASCEPADTCVNVTYGLDGSANYNESSPGKICDCGIICIKYDTCCVDSPYRRYNTRYYRGSEIQTCVQVYQQSDYILMVSECNPRWRGHSQIRNRCHYSDIRDPYSLVPVSDNKRNVTYKNFFCGICNFAEPESFTMWTITMNTKLYRNYSDEELVEYMTFNEDWRSWGHWEKSGDTWGFSPMSITINIPIDIKTRYCFSNMITNCDPDWSDKTISQKCLSYQAPVYATPNNSSTRQLYRNVHCAICNLAVFEEGFVCKSNIFTTVSHGVDSFRPGFAPPISFTLLFDVNPRDGVKVGKISKCKAGESYDPFFKKCRSLVCGIPGYVLKGNRCLMT